MSSVWDAAPDPPLDETSGRDSAQDLPPGATSGWDSAQDPPPPATSSWDSAAAPLNSTASALASTLDPVTDIVDDFESWYGKDISRSAHLCVGSSADEKPMSEVAGLLDMTTGFKLNVNLFFDKEQSCIKLAARFERENAVISSDNFQRISVKFHADAIENPAYLQFVKVKKEEDLPRGLRAFPNAIKYCERGELWVLDIEYIKSNIVSEGLYDRLDFAQGSKLQCVETLRRLLQVTDVRLYIRATSDSFSEALDQLKKKMRYELMSPPFHEYMSKSGRYTLQWNNSHFSAAKDTFPRRVTTTFRKIDYHRLVHGYGVMRDSGYQLKSVLSSLEAPMMASYVVLSKRKNTDGLPIEYLAFVQCDNEELIREVYLVGECGTFSFDKSPPGVEPFGWQYTVKPPIPRYEYPGNLIFQIKRAKGDNRELPTSPRPQLSMKQQEIWAFPDASDLAPRRLITAANLTKSLGSEADEMRRYICAQDLRPKERSHGLFDDMSDSQSQIINQLLSHLSPSQFGAYEHIKQAKHDMLFIQGPPGTGKTTFIVTLMQILYHLDHSWIACAPSNSATDHLATVLQQKCPEMGAIRFHAYDNEARAIRRQERAAGPEDNDDETVDAAAEGENDPADLEAAEDERVFRSYMAELLQEDIEWKGKLSRPNFKDMSLHVRAMQNAGIIEHDIKCFAPLPNDPHAEFRECLKNRAYSREKTDAEKERYKKLEDDLMMDTIAKPCGLITTLSKSADNKMRAAKEPIVAIIDECAQSTELETLLVWIHNVRTLRLVIFIGDPKQLPGTVKTHGQSINNRMVNPFADQMMMSFFERLSTRGFDTYMFTEQYRLAQGLAEVFSNLFYNGRIINAEVTKIQHRPKARAAIEFIRKHYGVSDNIPHVCLNVSDGVCLRGEMQSRYNLHNIVATTHAIRLMLDEHLWTEAEISVITPYRAQAARYRQVFRLKKWFKIQVFTVDSVQGRENECTIFDIVLAYARIGGFGFVKDRMRLNVALSRSINHFVFVCDMAALDHSARHKQELEGLDEEEREEREKTNRELIKFLQGVFSYFRSKRMIYLEKAEALDETSLVDMTPVADFKRRNACKNCGQQGHRRETCINPHAFSGTCNNCQEQGHTRSNCPHEKVFNGICSNCSQRGHKRMDCPTVVCKNCAAVGHSSFACPEPDRRTCGNCKETGHIRRDCPAPPRGRKLRFTLPDAEIDAGETVETEPTEHTVPMPTVPEAWAKLVVKESTLDPRSVAKELARDNESPTDAVDGSDAGCGDEKDEEEEEGDDIETVFGEDDGRQTGVSLQGGL